MRATAAVGSDARTSMSAGYAVGPTPRCTALDEPLDRAGCCPPRGGSPVQLRQSRGVELPRIPFTPRVPPRVLQQMLVGYDTVRAERLVSGFAYGFSTGCDNVPAGRAENNLPSCSEAPQVIDQYIQRECLAGRLAGPFRENHPNIIKISPIGLIPKKKPGSYRIIHHLSFPAGVSVNDFIPREYTSVTYGSVDEAVRLISNMSQPYLAKTDVANAFRIIPIRPEESPLLGFSWRGSIYMDLAMPMGCASSSKTFQEFSDALVWIAQHKFGVGSMVCVLDDFLFINESHDGCAASLRNFQRMCSMLHVPLRPDKTVEPCQSLSFLGVTLDAGIKELRLPVAKVRRMQEAISHLLPCRKVKLNTLQSCIGLLNFACIAVPLGRPFLRRLHDLCRGVRRPYHRVTISRAARLDLRAWQIFLSQFNGCSMMDGRRWHDTAGVLVETDASGSIGFGAICASAWLFGRWHVHMRTADIGEKELAAVVIAVQTWRYRLSHRCVLIRSDNESVVNCINTRTSRSPHMMRWLRHMFVIILLDNINVRAVHTPGCTNRAADALSRGSVQMFRRLRPAADPQPTVWSWPAFATRKRSAR